MKIKIANAGPLTNFEVLEFLKSRGASKDPTRVMSLLALSEFQVFDYLVEGPAANQTGESLKEFYQKSKEYGLNKTETISIINNLPRSDVELFPMIENYETHMQSKAEEFVEMLGQLFPLPDEDDAAAAESGKAANEENADEEMESNPDMDAANDENAGE